MALSSAAADCVRVCVRATLLAQGVRVVPEQSAWIVERFGKFSQVLAPGLHFLIPFVDRIAYVHSLKEQAIKIPNQTAITKVWAHMSLTCTAVLRVRWGPCFPMSLYCLRYLTGWLLAVYAHVHDRTTLPLASMACCT